MENVRVEYMALSELLERQHPRNPKDHAIDSIVNSISRFGFVTPGTIDERTERLAEGHGRAKALAWMKRQGREAPARIEDREDDWYVPVYRGVSFNSDAELEAFLVAANRLTVLGGWNEPELAGLLQDLAAQDTALLEATGYDGDDLQALLDELTPPEPAADPGAQIDRAEELQAEWQVVRGQVWAIPSKAGKGCHRLMCGDSTSADDVARLMDGAKAALLATDPPYNVSIAYGDNVDDSKADAEYEAFSRAWFDAWRSVSDRQIVTPGCNNLASWLRWFDAYHVAPWTKTNAMTNGKVARWWCWEPILFFGDGWKRGRANDVFDYPVSNQTGVANHPCPKPLKMWCDLIESYSERGDAIAESFSGSGTTLVACEQTGRIGFGMEIEPKYCAVTLQRLSDMGLTPRLVEDDGRAGT